ncbi:MAG: GtrA family protein [Pseudohongiellaceae bacterium]|nr:GtrA family protein [Pseudohongiellaceae bacterium]
MKIALLYSFFAVIATASNILAQEFSVLVISNSFALALALGTGVGLVVKYLLDRRYIFAAATKPVSQDSKQFIAYTLTGVLTTALFWGMEIGFDAFFDSRIARYMGAALGLGLGYVIKYQLDKRFVFTKREP